MRRGRQAAGSLRLPSAIRRDARAHAGMADTDRNWRSTLNYQQANTSCAPSAARCPCRILYTRRGGIRLAGRLAGEAMPGGTLFVNVCRPTAATRKLPFSACASCWRNSSNIALAPPGPNSCHELTRRPAMSGSACATRSWSTRRRRKTSWRTRCLPQRCKPC